MSNSALLRWCRPLGLPLVLGSAAALVLSGLLSWWNGSSERSGAGADLPVPTVVAGPSLSPGVAVESSSVPKSTAKVSALAVSPNGLLIGAIGEDGVIRVRTAATGDEVFAVEGHNGLAGTALVFSADGAQVISGGLDSEIRAWNVETKAEALHLQAHEHGVQAVSVSPDGTLIASAGQETRIMLWDAATGKLQAILSAHSDFINDLAFSADGQQLASAGGDKRVLLWDVSSRAVARTFVGHTSSVKKVKFGADPGTLISADKDGAAIIWDVASGAERFKLVGHRTSITAIAVSPNGERLVTASDDNQVLVWNPASGKVLDSFSGPSGAVSSLLFSDDGRLFVGGTGNSVVEWDADRSVALRQWIVKAN